MYALSTPASSNVAWASQAGIYLSDPIFTSMASTACSIPLLWLEHGSLASDFWGLHFLAPHVALTSNGCSPQLHLKLIVYVTKNK